MQSFKFKGLGYEPPELAWRYREIETALEWNMTPWEFDSRHTLEKAEMMAFVWAKRTVENYHMQKSEAAAEKKK